MRLLTFGLACVLLGADVIAQQDEVKPEKLVGWMRTVNTLEFEYKASHARFADEIDLLAYAKTAKTGSAVAFAKALAPASTHPYVLQILTGPDGSHYLATIRFRSDMQNESTWCKTEVFSGDSGLISLGQNIQCTQVYRCKFAWRLQSADEVA